MGDWLEFNIHNLVHMRVARSAPTASLFEDMFNPFLTSEVADYNLTIQGESRPFSDGSSGTVHGQSEFHYTDTELHLEALNAQIALDGDKFTLSGPSELLVAALPLVDHLAVTHGAAMVHALTVAYRGYGLCMPAWGGTGKTSTMSKLVKMDGFSFMGDDWAFLSKQGRLLGYAKPMFIKPYHRTLYPHLFSKRHKPLVPVRLSQQIHRMTTVVHPYVSKYPQLARLSRRWSPEHMMVMPRRAFPEAHFETDVPLAAALFVERFEGTGTSPVFEQKDKHWMVSRLIGNFNSELPHQSRIVMTALGAAGIVPIEQFFIQKSAVLDSALEGKPVYLLRVPQSLSPDQASDIIVKTIQNVLSQAGVN